MLIVRPGLLDRLKKTHGFASDAAMARLCGVSLNTYIAYRDGKKSPSAEFIANLGTALGMSVGEIAIIRADETVDAA